MITDLAVLGFHEETRRMQLESLHPGVELATVQAQTGFQLESLEPLGQTPLPTAEQLEILRKEVDPDGYIIGRDR